MPQASTEITDSGSIDASFCRGITFVVAGPGPVSVVSVPTPVPRPNQTETGLLGRIQLIRPGNPQVVIASIRVPIGKQQMALSYQPTAQDLASRGAWTCRICNETLFRLE